MVTREEAKQVSGLRRVSPEHLEKLAGTSLRPRRTRNLPKVASSVLKDRPKMSKIPHSVFRAPSFVSRSFSKVRLLSRRLKFNLRRPIGNLSFPFGYLTDVAAGSYDALNGIIC